MRAIGSDGASLMGDLPAVLTVPQVAAALQTCRRNIVSLIKRGEIRASDISAGEKKKPRFRVLAVDLEAFILRRAVGPKSVRPRRKQQCGHVTEYI